MSNETLNIIWQILNSDLPVPVKEVEAVAKAKQEFAEFAKSEQESVE